LSSDPKNPSSGLDDLKARLGLTAPTPRPAAQPAGSGAGQAETGGEAPKIAIRPPEPERAEEPEAAPAAPTPPRNYATEVQSSEERAIGEGDPTPLRMGGHDQIDPSLSTPMSGGTRAAAIGAALIGLIAALAVGFGFGKVMRERVVANEVIDDAAQLLQAVQPVADRWGAFQGALAGIEDTYSPELEAVFATQFAEGVPALSAAQLSSARVVLTTGEDLTRRILNYAVLSQQLAAQVQQHQALTAADRGLIEQLLADQGAVQPNYAILFENSDQTQAYYAFREDPVANPYTPPPARVVTYENLEMIVQGEGEETSHYYTVSDGQSVGQVPIYNLLRLSADQLIENTNEETALDRYRRRVSLIRERLAEMMQLQQALIADLTERSNQPHRFTL
jgi:hypothetical protein